LADVSSINDTLRRKLDAIAALESTVDITDRASYVSANGWNVDDSSVELPAEIPGPPLDTGSFSAAVAVLTAYSFPPVALIRGHFDPTATLLGRPMLLTARYLWMTFELAVRVSRVIDEARDTPDGLTQVWGYSYTTLHGHLEQGEITFEIAKTVGTGAVHFRIYSFSRRGDVGNLLYRLGFRVVGRSLQRRFVRESLQNMQALVTTRMHNARAGQASPRSSASPQR
jgi:uncharacterized protein (UPF0548 family)